MAERWELKIEEDNRGNPLNVWAWLDYELSQNVNLGLEGGWVFELTFKGKYVALYPTLKAGKEGAREHDARSTPPTPEQLELEAAS